MTRVTVAAAVFLAWILPAAGADLSIKPGDRVVRVQVKDAGQLQALLDMDLDVWSHEVGVGPVDVHVSVRERKELDAAGWTYTTMQRDLMRAYLDELQGNLRGGAPFAAYPTLAEIVQFINDLATNRPDLCEVFSIGQSLQGRDIWVLHVTGPDDGNGPPPGQRPAVFYHGLQHAREWITGPTVLHLADQLVNNYDADPCIRALVDRTDFYLAPCVNPDGYEYSWTTQRLWRKNRRDNGDGTFGVDLNRNWAFGWGGGGSSGVTDSETYHGTGPFSEPETQALSNFIISRPTIRAYMDYHSFSQLILWPFGTTCTEPPEPDRTTYDALGAAMRQDILDAPGVNYVDGPVCLTLYQASGASVDWVYGEQGRIAFTIELRDTGQFGFLLPPEQILPTVSENLPAILRLSRFASFGVEVEALDPPEFVDAGVTNQLLATVTENAEMYVPGSGLCHYRTDPTGPFQTVPLNPIGQNVFAADVPAVPCGATLEYYFTAEGDGGFQATSPCDAPATTWTALAQRTTVAFADAMEVSDNGWQVGAAGDDASTGIWGRMDPEGTAAQPEDDHTPTPGAICWVTDGRAGTGVGSFDVDDGRTTLLSPMLDLSGVTDPIAGYWRWYSNDQGGSPNQDVFIVDISNDGGQSWVNAETIGPAGPDTAGGWTYHEFLVSDIVAPTSQVRLRFIAADEGGGSIVEAAIDDFEITERGCPCTTILGDVDGNNVLDARDVSAFVTATLSAPNYHPCADAAAPFAAPIDAADQAAFVELLLGH